MPGIYRASSTDASSCLLQGELLSDLDQVRLTLATVGDSSPAVQSIRHSFAIILSQACDLEQDFRSRGSKPEQHKNIPSVLFCEVFAARAVVDNGKFTNEINGKLWSNIKTNKNERYQFLEQVDAACDAQQIGLPELTIDFKRYFTLPTDEVYLRVGRGLTKRRCVLETPYLEHLSSRFAYYLSRIGLPQDHTSIAEPS